MSSLVRRVDDLVIIDASIEDYAPLFSDDLIAELSCRHFSTGEEALQRFVPSDATLWIVNVRLPDMSGIGFLHLARCRSRRCTVFLVGDDYRSEDELAARAAGASAYLCKPVNAAWLRLYRSAVSRIAVREGGAPHISLAPVSDRGPPNRSQC